MKYFLALMLFLVGMAVAVAFAITIITATLYVILLAALVILGIFALRLFIIYTPKIVMFARTEYFRLKDSIVGTPGLAMDSWHWQNGPTCAINTQRIVLSLFGIEKNETQLAGKQSAYGEYSGKYGTNDPAFLLESYGLNVKRLQEWSIWQWPKICNGLRAGKVYIFTVNSFMLNNADDHFSTNHKLQVDHVVLLTAVKAVDGLFFAYYMDSGVFDGSVKCTSLNNLFKAKGDLIIETPKVAKENQSAQLPKKKIISCIKCRYRLRVPFGKKLKVTCKKCHASFFAT